MIFVTATDSTIDARVKQSCAPLFATHEFLATGHDESKTSATVSFVKFGARIYGVTCHHVLAAFFAEAARQNAKIAPTIHSDGLIQKISLPSPGGSIRGVYPNEPTGAVSCG
jgi:hypothetical protein